VVVLGVLVMEPPRSGPAVGPCSDPPGTGTAITGAGAPKYLGMARLTRTGIEANTGICRGMLRHRYAETGAGEEAEG